MPRLPLVHGAALAALVALAPSVHAASDPRTWERDFPVARQPIVRVRTDDARVTVRSWKESRVKVRVERLGSTEGFVLGHRHPRVEIGKEGNQVTVVARMDGSSSGLVISTARLEVEVWLPRQSDLIVDTQDGGVSVEDVAGHIELETQDGSVTGRGLRGDIRVRSADGRVSLDDLDGSLRLECHDGHSDVRGRFDRLDAESADGGIDIDARAGSRMRAEWSVRSQDGGIRLRIPHDLAATLDARTADGSLVVDFPVQVQGSIRNHEILGDLNGGGPTLRLRCSDGGIRLSAID